MAQRAILVIAGNKDDHATHMKGVFDRLGIAAFFVDIGEANALQSLSLSFDSSTLFSLGSISIGNPDLTVWWRRAQQPQVDDRISDTKLRQFAKRQWEIALNSGFALSKVRYVNNPFKERIAILKPLQLKTAAAVGFSIPKTLITNQSEEAERFISTLRQSGKRCIFKPLWPAHYHFGETRIIESLDGLVSELAVAPVIFQECIEKGEDVRFTIFGTNTFASIIKTSDPELIDWRIDPNVDYTPTSLSHQIIERARNILDSLGLVTGSFDIRFDRTGCPYFFEINPSGQFLYLENFGYPEIGERFARFLSD